MNEGFLRSKTFEALVLLTLCYLIFVAGLAFFQRSLVFHPSTAPFDPKAWVLRELQPMDVTLGTGVKVRSWYTPPKDDNHFVLVFFQDAQGSLGLRSVKLRTFLDAGYGVLAVGFRGFGNDGQPTQATLVEDAQAALTEIKNRGLPEEAMVFYGEGTGAYLALSSALDHPHAAGILLDSAFPSLTDLAKAHFRMLPVDPLLEDKLDNFSLIAQTHLPLLFLSGARDAITSEKLARRLFDEANTPKTAVFEKNATMPSLFTDNVRKNIKTFLERLPREPLHAALAKL